MILIVMKSILVNLILYWHNLGHDLPKRTKMLKRVFANFDIFSTIKRGHAPLPLKRSLVTFSDALLAHIVRSG